MFPAALGTNPYLDLLHGALGESVSVVAAEPYRRGWWREAEADVVHLHWLEAIEWEAGPATPEVTRTRAATLLENLRGLRMHGARVIWTVHNLRPHESRHPELDAELGRAVVGEVDAVVVHSEFAARRVREELGEPRALVVAPHGHYGAAYPPEARSRALGPRAARPARRRVRVPDVRDAAPLQARARGGARVPRPARLGRAAADRRRAAPGHARGAAGGGGGRAADRARPRVHRRRRDRRLPRRRPTRPCSTTPRCSPAAP